MPTSNVNPNTVIVTEDVKNVVLSTAGPQGPRGRTILNGNGVPAENFGLEGDFYYDKITTKFYGPKLQNTTWAEATSYFLSTGTLTYPFSLLQLVNAGSYYYLEIVHNLGYHPNVTVKSSAGDVLETGIDYNSINKITLTMVQPFSGTAYLS
jgi:hypothetical protein